jgi:ASC-1-like (ASCH) protein
MLLFVDLPSRAFYPKRELKLNAMATRVATHVLYISRTQYHLYLLGSKSLETKVAYSDVGFIKKGDRVIMKSVPNDRGVERTVQDIRHYASLEELVENENVGQIRPHYQNLPLEDVLAKIRLSKKKDLDSICRLGILVFDLES